MYGDCRLSFSCSSPTVIVTLSTLASGVPSSSLLCAGALGPPAAAPDSSDLLAFFWHEAAARVANTARATAAPNRTERLLRAISHSPDSSFRWSRSTGRKLEQEPPRGLGRRPALVAGQGAEEASVRGHLPAGAGAGQ